MTGALGFWFHKSVSIMSPTNAKKTSTFPPTPTPPRPLTPPLHARPTTTTVKMPIYHERRGKTNQKCTVFAPTGLFHTRRKKVSCAAAPAVESSAIVLWNLRPRPALKGLRKKEKDGNGRVVVVLVVLRLENWSRRKDIMVRAVGWGKWRKFRKSGCISIMYDEKIWNVARGGTKRKFIRNNLLSPKHSSALGYGAYWSCM